MNLGAPELIIILVIALLVLGPGKLPEVGSALGKSIREFRKATADIQESVKVDTNPMPAQQPPAPQQYVQAPPPQQYVQAPPAAPVQQVAAPQPNQLAQPVAANTLSQPTQAPDPVEAPHS